jgi:hypothetical protein
MKIMKLFFLMLLILLLSSSVNAIEPPKIFVDGCDAYKKEGFDKAFSIWMKDSPLENDKTSLMNMKGGITQIETLYGKMIGYDIVKVYQITKVDLRVYGVLYYERGPLYVYADCYKSGDHWLIPEFQLHTKAQMILPNELIYKE